MSNYRLDVLEIKYTIIRYYFTYDDAMSILKY